MSEKQSRPLRKQQQVFVEEYLRCWNASEAARKAGYRGRPNTIGTRLLSNVVIAAEIQARLAELKLGSDEVLTRLGKQARGSLAPFIHQAGERVIIDLDTEEARENIDLIKKLKTKRRSGGRGDGSWTEYEVEIELHDPQAALVHIGRHHGLFKDIIEHDWRKQAEQDGVNPGELFDALVAHFAAQMVGPGGEGSVPDRQE